MAMFAIIGQNNAVVSSNHKYQIYGSTDIFDPQTFAYGDLDEARAYGLLINLMEVGQERSYVSLKEVSLHMTSPTSMIGLSCRIESNMERFDPSSVVTYDSKPESVLLGEYSGIDLSTGGQYNIIFRETVTANNAAAVLNLIKNGFYLTEFIGIVHAGQTAGTEPVLLVEYELAALTVVPSAPVGSAEFPAVVPQSAASVFSWIAKQPDDVYTLSPVLPVSSVLRWRVSGGTEVHEIAVTGDATSVTVPANTFPAGAIDWQVSVTANSGAVTTSDWATATVIAPQIFGASPAAGGYVPKYQDCTFRWSIQQTQPDGTTVGLTQASAVFRWRNTGSTTVQTATVGAQTQITMPSGTFTADSIDWQVAATTDAGTVVTSEWYTCSTVEALSAARAIYPKNTTIDGSLPVTFRWDHVIATGTAQTAFDLQTSTDNASWTPLAGIATAETSYTVAAGLLPGGDLYWRVRTYNTDDAAGEWSDPAYGIVILAPAAPVVTVAEAAPRFAVRWTQSGQEAYEILLDGEVVARNFGGNSTYRHAEFLSDGVYLVGVRIQNKYGLWSEVGTAALTVQNTATQTVALQAAVDGEAVQLDWSLSPPYTRAMVYRNGVLIADRDGLTSLIDHFAPGSATYQVRSAVPDGAAGYDGMYAQSDPVAIAREIPCLMITAAVHPNWLKIPLAETSLRKLTTSMSRSVGYVNSIAGGLPTAAIGNDVGTGLQISCAFLIADKASALALESLLGQVVCVRSATLDPAFYVLDRINRTQNVFYRTYALTLTQVAYDEVTR